MENQNQEGHNNYAVEEKWWIAIGERAYSIAQFSEELKAIEERLSEHEHPITGSSREAGKVRIQVESINDRLHGLKKELLTVIKTGAENNYTVPASDHKLMVLTRPRPQYTEDARATSSGRNCDS
ncbi:MAG TPA: hypothetical protein VFC63_10235 [Blastocatellia bacterium]|nr:hypothetical protein [Blastocatellia bacterium]